MAMIEIKSELTDRERVAFALLGAALCGILGWIALARPEHLLRSAGVCAGALAISLLFNREQTLRSQLAGLGLVAALAAAGGLDRLGVPRMAVAAGAWAVGAGAGVVS